MELALELLSHFKAELVIIVIATIMSIIQNDPAGTSYITILIINIRLLLKQLLEPVHGLLLTQRQITSAARGAMHLQSQFNDIASLKSIQVISQLFSINVLSKSRTEINLSLTTLGATVPFARSLPLRNILLTDLNAIQHSDGVAFLQVRHSGKISQTSQRQKQTIRLFTAQLHGLNIALLRIQITTARITIFILTTNQIVHLTKLFRQLTINREINTQLTLKVVQRNNYSITKAISQLQTICVGVLTNILQASNISTVSHFFYLLIF